MTTFQDLIEFTRDAEKNRNYPAATGVAFRNAISKFLEILNEEEKQSVDLFENRIDQVFRYFVEKNKQKMTMKSMLEYKRRVQRVISDHKEYGLDPTKMANWQRKPKKMGARKAITKQPQDPIRSAENGFTSPPDNLITEGSVIRFEIPLRKGVKAVVITPPDITPEEVKKIKLYVEYLEAIAPKESTN